MSNSSLCLLIFLPPHALDGKNRSSTHLHWSLTRDWFWWRLLHQTDPLLNEKFVRWLILCSHLTQRGNFLQLINFLLSTTLGMEISFFQFLWVVSSCETLHFLLLTTLKACAFEVLPTVQHHNRSRNVVTGSCLSWLFSLWCPLSERS